MPFSLPVLPQVRIRLLEHNPMCFYSEVSPIVFKGMLWNATLKCNSSVPTQDQEGTITHFSLSFHIFFNFKKITFYTKRTVSKIICSKLPLLV